MEKEIELSNWHHLCEQHRMHKGETVGESYNAMNVLDSINIFHSVIMFDYVKLNCVNVSENVFDYM